MDPLTLLAVLSGLAMGGAVAGEIDYQRTADKPLLVKTVWSSGPDDPNQWEATELLSEGALEEVGIIFDLDLGPWNPMIESGFYRAIVLAEVGHPQLNRHIVFRTRLQGQRWELDVAFTKGQAKINPLQRERIEQALASLDSATGYDSYQPPPAPQIEAPPELDEREGFFKEIFRPVEEVISDWWSGEDGEMLEAEFEEIAP